MRLKPIAGYMSLPLLRGKTNFEKSGEPGVAILKIEYGQDGETIIFNSDEAQKEYDNRHSKKISRLP